MSAVLIYEDLLHRDLYSLESIEDAIDSINDIGKNINKASLYYAWMVGRFADSDRLQTKFNSSMEDLAERLGVSKQTLYRYRKVKQMLTEAELTVLAERSVSINAIMEIATIGRHNATEAKQLMEGLLDGSLDITTKDVKEANVQLVNQRRLPYNMMPGGEPPPQAQSEEDTESLEDITSKVDAEDTDPAQSLLDFGDDYDFEGSTPSEERGSVDSGDPSQNRRDAKAMLRAVRSSVTVIRRDFANIINNLEEQLIRVEQAQSVILGDQQCSDEYDVMLSDMYQDMCRVLPILLKQSCRGVESGMITRQIEAPAKLGELFDGKGLLVEEQ